MVTTRMAKVVNDGFNVSATVEYGFMKHPCKMELITHSPAMHALNIVLQIFCLFTVFYKYKFILYSMDSMCSVFKFPMHMSKTPHTQGQGNILPPFYLLMTLFTINLLGLLL
jgi:hypothetical protein